MEPTFFEAVRTFSAAEIAALTGATLLDPRQGTVSVSHIASAGQAGQGALAYVNGARNLHLLRATRASAIFCPSDLAPSAPAASAVLVTGSPQRDFVKIARLLYPGIGTAASITGQSGVSEGAHVSPEAEIESGAVIEPGAVIGPRAVIGSGTVISANAVIGPSCRVGRDGYVGPNASVQNALLGDRVIIHGGAQIGRAGFGFVSGPRGPERIPQIGRVILQDDVEIGANSTVDRGAMDDTVIGEGTKIDNLVQIAHNVRIGRGCILAGHCGLSGSVTVGDFTMLGGRVGIADHVTIGSHVVVTGGSGLLKDIPDGEKWGGYPAQPIRTHFREVAALRALARGRRQRREADD